MKILRSITYHICSLAVAMLLVTVAGCSRKHHDSRLSEIALTVATSPVDALARLDSIDPRTLPTADRHFHELLTVKARDKAYITHTDDSLILTVIDWYSHNDDPALYTEALYYGGRVYADIGDLNTALRYFHLALDRLPEDTPDINLRANVLSQTGRLLNNLRMYSDAIPYIKLCLRTDSLLRDTFCLAYDSQLLGSVYLGLDSFAAAEHYLTEAESYSRALSDNDHAFMQGFLARLKYRQGDVDSAAELIADVPQRVDSLSTYYFISEAAKIFFAKALTDSCHDFDRAIQYALDAAGCSEPSYRLTGYRILLSPEICRRLSTDSVTALLRRYDFDLETVQSRFDTEAAMIQNSLYNYSRIERDRATVSERLRWTERCLALLVILCSGAYIFVILYKRRIAQRLLELAEIRKVITADTQPLREIDSSFINLSAPVADLQTELKQEIARIARALTSVAEYSPDPRGLALIREAIDTNKILSDDDIIWTSLADIIRETAPDFFIKLDFLNRRPVSPMDSHIIVLTRFGIQPSTISELLGRAKSTISGRRADLCKNLFHNAISLKQFGNAVRVI